MTYVIQATTYYYSGTYNALPSGYLKDRYDNVFTFSSKKEAFAFLEKNFGVMELVKGENTFANAGRYVLKNGEYSRPLFTIKKV